MTSCVVTARSREIAIRMAVGARRGAVLSMIVRQSMLLALVGLALGAIAAFVGSRIVQSEYHGVQGVDLAAFGGSAAVFVLTMLLASGLAAQRAARLDAVSLLKEG